MSVWVKICGVTRVEDALAAFGAGADAIGINFWPRSKRYCPPQQAREIVAALPAGCLVYGVFVDASRADIGKVAAEVGLGGVQLHGSEAESEARRWALPVLRAIGATSRAAVVQALEAAAAASQGQGGYRVLIDNAAGGGSGRLVDPDVLAGLDLSRAILAGGLTPANVSDIVARFAPFGVDTAGGVEAAAGIKDPRLIEEFIAHARSAR